MTSSGNVRGGLVFVRKPEPVSDYFEIMIPRRAEICSGHLFPVANGRGRPDRSQEGGFHANGGQQRALDLNRRVA